MSAGAASSDRPSQAPRAERSQCGQASPASAGTKAMPRSIAGRCVEGVDLGEVGEQAEAARPVDGGRGAVDAAVERIGRLPRRPSARRRWAAARRPRSRINCAGDGEREGAGAEGDLGVAGIAAAMAVERRLLVDDRGGERHGSAADATACRSRRCSARSRAAPRAARRTGRRDRHPSGRWRDSISEVREAVARSVTKRPVSRSRKKASVVPSRSRPLAASARASGISRMIQPSLEAEK